MERLNFEPARGLDGIKEANVCVRGAGAPGGGGDG